MTLRLLPLVLLAGCATAQTSAPPSPLPEAKDGGSVGVLIMAHGGDEAWNRTVTEAVRPVSGRVPTAIAFGMADPASLTTALDELSTSGVDRVAVVRMFLSGESFRDQTLYFLGLSDTPPSSFVLMSHHHEASTDPAPIAHTMDVATHPDGLMTSLEAGSIIGHRAREASERPGQESVLLIAHGMGDDDENGRVEQAMRVAVSGLRTEGFAGVEVRTLREDWADERALAESSIRSFAKREHAEGRRVVVIPFRLSGFGPYADVLEGLEYSATPGLLPHPSISQWIRRTATSVACHEGWGDAIDPCPPTVTTPASPVSPGPAA